jgi:hypothetical protein
VSAGRTAIRRAEDDGTIAAEAAAGAAAEALAEGLTSAQFRSDAANPRWSRIAPLLRQIADAMDASAQQRRARFRVIAGGAR